VREAAVLGLADHTWGETVAAVIVPDDPVNPPDPAALHAHCREHLAPHKTPTSWYVSGELPLTGSGKVQKFRIREQVEAGELTGLGG
jgi:fatty-acyl-CoA synthase